MMMMMMMMMMMDDDDPCRRAGRRDPGRLGRCCCGVVTGLGAVWNNRCNVEGGASSVAVFGLGLSVIQRAKRRGAKRIFSIDTNPGCVRACVRLG